jgi:hypothetical protein
MEQYSSMQTTVAPMRNQFTPLSGAIDLPGRMVVDTDRRAMDAALLEAEGVPQPVRMAVDTDRRADPLEAGREPQLVRMAVNTGRTVMDAALLEAEGEQQPVLMAVDTDRRAMDADPLEAGWEPQLVRMEFLEREKDARETLREILKVNSSDAQRMLHYLEGLARSYVGFTYRVSFDCDGIPTGFVWMTPVMRRQFELYGDVLFLDCMKRTANSVNWPYIGPVVVDGDCRISMIAESIVCSERLEAYKFVLDSVFDMAPLRSRDTLRIIFGDGIMSDSLLRMLDIQDSCKICLDCYHLLEEDWPNKLGVHYFPKIKPLFEALMYSTSEEEYNTNLEVIRERLQGNRGHLEYVEREIHCNREKFVRFWVSAIEGN